MTDKLTESTIQAFAVAIPHEQATDAKDEIAFFQAVKARLEAHDLLKESEKTLSQTLYERGVDAA